MSAGPTTPAVPRVTGAESDLPLAAFLTFGAMAALGPAATNMYLPALPSLVADLHVSQAVGQLSLSATIAGIALGQLVAGPISDCVGRRRPAIWGLVGFVLLTLGCAAAPNVGWLLTLRFLEGAAGSFAWVMARASIRDLRVGAGAARAYSRLSAVTGLAPILSPVIGGQLLRFTDWRGVFVGLAAIGAVVLVVAGRWFVETAEPAPAGAPDRSELRAHLRAMLTDWSFLGSLAIASILGVLLWTYLSTTPFILTDDYNLSASEVSVVFALSALVTVLVNQLNGAVVMRFGPAVLLRVDMIALLLGAIYFAVVLATHAPLPFVLIAIGIGPAAAGAAVANLTALTLVPWGHAIGTAASLLGMCQFLLGAALPPLMSGVTTSPAAVGFMAVACTAVGAAVNLAVRFGRSPVPTGMA